MRMHRVLLWLAVVASVLTACSSGKGVTDPAVQHAALRIVNLIPNASGPLNVSVDDNTLVSGLAFEGLTQYESIDAGSRVIQVSVAGGVSNIVSTTLSFTGTNNYTLVVYGTAGEPTTLLVTDTVVDPGAGNFNLRLLNAAVTVAAVDIYVTAPGADLNAAAPSIGGVSLGSASAVVTLPAGNIEIRVTPTGTKNVIYDSTPQSISERASIEAVVYTRTSSRLVGVTLLNLDSAGTSITAPNILARFKVVNGSSLASPLNVFVNSNLLLSNIPFGGASSYQLTTAGAPTVAIEATATPGAALLTLMPALGPGTDSSILLTGAAGALQALVLGDNNLPPVANRARVRFVNGTSDVSVLDVYANFSKVFSALAMNSASTGLEFSADPDVGTSYEFDFAVAGTVQPSLKLPGVALFGGKTYTVYVVGSQAALSGIVTGDN
jgi:trimeric autotransporter adhesin